MSDPFSDLDGLLTHVWQRMLQGAAEADDPMRRVTFATIGVDGPQIRIVALRRADRRAGEVEVHSDRRTAKVESLARDPRGAILLWDAEAQLQIRVNAAFRLVHADPDRWASVPDVARLNYGTDPAPGTRLPGPEAFTRTPCMSRFSALVGAVQSMDIVSLAHDPHRRAQFDGSEGPGRWVAP